jgi:hypothetical protein
MRVVEMSTSNIVGLLIAALGGAAVGLERQWSGHAEGPGARFAGIRTFTMLGAVGGFSGWLWTAGVTAPAAILLAGAVAVVAAAYVAGSRQEIDGTTEVAALVVLAAGLLAGMGSIRLASGVIALATLLLVEKSRLHALFGVELCWLPGPPCRRSRPRISRHWSPRGPGLVDQCDIHLCAKQPGGRGVGSRALAFGAVAANAMLYPRVLVATAILNAAVVPPLVPYLAPPALVAALVAALWDSP